MHLQRVVTPAKGKRCQHSAWSRNVVPFHKNADDQVNAVKKAIKYFLNYTDFSVSV